MLKKSSGAGQRAWLRAGVVTIAVAMGVSLLGWVVVEAPDAQAASAGWCNTYTYVYSPPYYIYVPSIGNGGARNCTMSSGSVSNGVLAMQSTLKNCFVGIGSDPGVLDGIWGANTTKGLKAFQSWMRITVDGVYGPQTHNSLSFASVLKYNPNSTFVCWMDKKV
jgi:peptidoglycan hydrolase-like protein with peptidoglycan-binding domain